MICFSNYLLNLLLLWTAERTLRRYENLMMKKTKLLPALLLCMAALALHAQPQPCGTNPEMTSFCNQACIICDIDGFTGINDDPQQGQAPPGFCTTQVHHMQWIGFIAGSTNLKLSVRAFNCQMNQGLEVGIYQSLNCQTFQLVTNCDTDISNNETAIFSNTVPLTIGQYYFFVMDGSAGDVCNYTIEVLEGTTAVNALTTSGTLSGDQMTCIENSDSYHLDAPSGATMFNWTLNGTPIAGAQGTDVTVDWAATGTYNLCVTAFNVCDTAPPVCQTIVVQGIPPTIINTGICGGECWEGADTTICDAGQYELHLTGHQGCDSTIFVNIEMLPGTITNLDLLICEGDTIFIGGQPFFETGQYQNTLSATNACDSIVNLTLQVIVCEIVGELAFTPVLCAGESSGQLRFSVANGTPPFSYSWQRIGAGSPSGTGMLAALNTDEVIDNLPVGVYFITIMDNFGNDVILFGSLTEPSPLASETTLSMFNGNHVSCFGGSDGSISVTPSGGVPPYSFQWGNGGQTSTLNNLAAGDHSGTLTDANGCELALLASLTAPPELLLEADFFDPTCDGVNTGAAQVTNTTGGTPPYEYALSGIEFGSDLAFANLSPGLQTLSVRDANGCIESVEGTLIAPLIPEIDLGADRTVLLAESTRLSLAQTTPLDSFLWSPPTGLSCTDCPQPEATPFQTTTYLLRVIAPGGCTTMDSLTVHVIAQRDVYVPNSFSPNSDGINDRFMVFGGPEVLEIRSLNIWSRWGEHVFRAQNLPPNLESAGWDGRFRGEPVQAGSFVWVAEIAFVDGVVLQYKGDVAVLR